MLERRRPGTPPARQRAALDGSTRRQWPLRLARAPSSPGSSFERAAPCRRIWLLSGETVAGAKILFQVSVRYQSEYPVKRIWLGKGHLVVESICDFQMPQVGTPIALRQVQGFAMRLTGAVKPA